MRGKMRQAINDLNIVAVEEGAVIDDEIVQDFDLSFLDLGKSSNMSKTCAFTGVVIRGNNLLVALPKHYVSIEKFDKLTIKEKLCDIKLILKTIMEYEINPNFSSFRKENDLSTKFSFKAYYDVFNYYHQYGLFYKESSIFKTNASGKISWKKTLNKANKIISNGNLVFAPFFIKKTAHDENFVTRCMIFVINYTEELFADIIDLPDNSRLLKRGVETVLRDNSGYVIVALSQIRSRTFKDIDKKLIDDLISFFQGLNSNVESVKDIKHYHYNDIWEKGVEKYLNRHFSGIINTTFNFMDKGLVGPFKKITLSQYDKANPRNIMQPDHYYYDSSDDTQYIFDSKYYRFLNSINYKQVVYHMLMINRAAHTYDALIMPTEEITYTEKHLDLSENYIISPSYPITILLLHLNTNDVLNDFIS